MTVWVVESGTQYEGGSVRGLFATREMAEKDCREYAEAESSSMVKFCLERPSPVLNDAEEWRVKEQPIEADYHATLVLEWGCYYACVKPMQVQSADDNSSNHKEPK